MTTLLPSWLQHSGLGFFVLELAFVALLVAGFVQLWEPLRRRLFGKAADGEALLAESVLVGPWLLLPVLLLTGLAGAYRAGLAAAQIVCLGAGTILVLRRFRSMRRPAVPRLDLGLLSTFLAGATICLFVVWAWAMPIPESFNGHYHGWVNQLSDLDRTGRYHAVDSPSYDTVPFASPSVFFLAPFSLPWGHWAWLRPTMLVPPLLALSTLLFMRSTAAVLSRRWIGSLAFLLVAFNHYTPWEFSEISGELISGALLAYFAFHVAVAVQRGRVQAAPLLFALVFAWTFRKQTLLVIISVALALVLFKVVPWSGLLRRIRSIASATAVGAFVLVPFLASACALWAFYGSPTRPQSEVAGVGSFGFDHVSLWLHGHALARTTGTAGTGNFILEHFFPLHPHLGAKQLVIDLFRGLSVPLLVTLGVIAFLLFAGAMPSRILRAQPKLLRRLLLAYLVGFVVLDYLVFPEYDKFQHLIIYLVALFPAMLLAEFAVNRLAAVAVGAFALLLCAVGWQGWAATDWGHAERARASLNLRLLWPQSSSLLERIARKTSRSPASLGQEIEEYVRALDATRTRGGRILFTDEEPGALVPVLVDRQYLGNALYLEQRQAAPVVRARDCTELRAAFRSLGVRFVYEPGRPHVTIAQTYVMGQLLHQRSRWRYVVPVQALCSPT